MSRLIRNSFACYLFTGSLRAGFRNLAHSVRVNFWRVR